MHTPHSPTLQARQFAFGQALLQANLPAPEGILGAASERRFNVYRNNVVTGLVSTLCDAYPATVRLVGDAFFRAMAKGYALAHPPGSPMMFDYGADFPAFIDAFAAARDIPYLGDVARIERAWVEAYHAAEAAPLSGPTLRDVLAGSDLRLLTVTLHPSLCVLTSPFPALSIWEMNTGSMHGRTIQLDDGAEETLIVRPQADVHLHRLRQGGAAFFIALAKGYSLVDAADQALAGNGAFDLVAAIATLVDAGLIVGTQLDHDDIPSIGE